MKMIRPTMTGETAIGRSTIEFNAPTPGKRWRTMRSAQRIPNTVLSGTAIAATISVSFSAWSASGVVIPCEGERNPREDRGRQGRQDDPPHGGRARGAERDRRLLHVLLQLVQDGLDGADDERKSHERERECDRPAGLRQVDVRAAVRPVE